MTVLQYSLISFTNLVVSVTESAGYIIPMEGDISRL